MPEQWWQWAIFAPAITAEITLAYWAVDRWHGALGDWFERWVAEREEGGR